MIQVDISNIWGQLTLRDLLALEQQVFDAHNALTEGTGVGSEQLGWMNLPTRIETDELKRIRQVADTIRANSDILVVTGIGGSNLGSRAAIELLQGVHRNHGKGKGDPEIIFAGNSLSTRRWQSLEKLLQDRDFSLLIISKSGSTTEPAIATRGFRSMLEHRYGTDGARSRIYAITDPIKGGLRQMAEEAGWESFTIPPSVGGRYSVLSPVGLLPMAVAGIDIMALLSGAMDAKERYDLRSFENPVWLYAAVRTLMYGIGKKIEILASFEPDFGVFGSWWQHLFAESQGKQGKGLFPVPSEYPGDIHTLGQLIQQGERNLFETVLHFDPPGEQVFIGSDERNADGLNYLAGKPLDFVEEQAFTAAVEAHNDGNVPVVTVNCGSLTEETVGELFWFMELSCAISGILLGINPFNQPGVDPFKRRMLHLLGKPGYELL